MRRVLPFIVVLLFSITASAQVDFTSAPIADHLNIPWDLVEGPDGYIWYTERIGIISRIHPDTKARDTILDFRNSVINSVEVGLLGMALHPNFSQQPFVFAAYAFKSNDIWIKRVFRARYDGTTLVDINTIYELKPAQQYHQGCRVIILPDTTLMFTNGDQPFPDSTYSLTSEVGKTIRINLDGSVPADNPYPGSKIWSVGHRNPQGMCQLPNGNIFSSEHGDNIEDEINLITKAGNYGWPKVEGKCDTPAELLFCAANNVIQPTWSSGAMTLAPSGLEYYPHTRYPASTGKLLGVFLKSSRLMSFGLSADQKSVTSEKHMLVFRYGRLRDVLVMQNGRLFVCTGNYGARGIEPFPKADHDVILELLPVWAHEKPKVRVPSDTVVYRADPGDTLKSFVDFCSDGGTPVFYKRLFTNPGNIFEQRFYGDGASTEFSDCWPFRVYFKPQMDYPYSATATVFFANPNEAEDSRFATLIGLPKKGYVRATKDMFSASAGRSVVCTARNIGLDTVLIQSALIVPTGSASTDASQFPIRVGPGELISLVFNVNTPIPLNSIIGVQLLTNSFRDATFSIKIVPVSVDDSEPVPVFTMAPQPVVDVIHLSLENEVSCEVKIHDIMGRLAYSAQHNGSFISIPIKSFSGPASNGVHTLSVSARGLTRTTSFLLAR
ncbi:MAG: PQQ-dependent sugar dehydrogenase [Candidatus Kapabacteria bacterium]|nr:PQQ-dependent sugar dehydrogenase [Candidatus Kapabacteria bacterium]